MATKHKKIVKKDESLKYGIQKACLVFRLTGVDMRVAERKFKGQEHFEEDWSKLFKKHDILGK
jgi:hypothetical protein